MPPDPMQSSPRQPGPTSRSALATLAARIVAAGLATLLLVALGRLLAKEDVGAFLWAWSWLEVLTVTCGLGLEPLLVRETAVARGDEARRGLLRGLLRAADRAVAATSLSVAVVVALALAAFGLDAALRAVLWVALLALPLRVLTVLRQGTLQGAGQALWSLIPLPIVQPALLLAFVVAVALGTEGSGAVEAMACSVVATAVALAAASQRRRTHAAFTLGNADVQRQHRVWLRAALPLAFISASALLMTRLDSLLLGILAGPASVADLGIATRAAEIARFGLLAAVPVFSAPFAAHHASGDRVALQRDLRRASRLAVGVAAGATALLAGAGPWLLRLVGPDYGDAYGPLLVLLIAECIRAASGPAQRLMLMTGGERLLAAGYVLALAVNASLCLLLIPTWGAVGAASATTLTSLVWNVALVAVVRRRLGVDPAVTCLLRDTTGVAR